MKNWKICILLSMLLLVLSGTASAGETLYNGIELPDEWPPRYDDGGPQPCNRVTKMLLVWPGLDRCSTIGFRCVADM